MEELWDTNETLVYRRLFKNGQTGKHPAAGSLARSLSLKRI